MTTGAKIGHGTILQVATPEVPLVYAALAEVTNIQPPSTERELHDVTHMESEDGWREFIIGLKEGSEMTVSMNFIPGSATDVKLRGMFDTDEPYPFKIIFNSGAEMGFQALITGYAPEIEVGAPMTAEATFKMTAKPDFTDPS